MPPFSKSPQKSLQKSPQKSPEPARLILTRRGIARHGLGLLGATALLSIGGTHGARAQGIPNNPHMGERSAGSPDAKIVVEEWFSLTCTHCARFARDVFPDIRSKLIETGKIRYIFRDYPLDGLALMAAQVARYLPDSRYEPFVLALFETQMTWAFDRTRDPKQELAKLAALAGMPRATFDAAVADTSLRDAILAVQSEGESRLKIASTPTFVVAGKATAGEQSYDSFVKLIGLG